MLVLFLLASQIEQGVLIPLLLLPIWPDFELFTIFHQEVKVPFLEIFVFMSHT